jgi:hypothetical protein
MKTQKTFSITLDAYGQEMLEQLEGAQVESLLGRNPITFNGKLCSRSENWQDVRRMWFQEILAAAAAFHAANGYIPRLPRFEIATDDEGRPLPDRRNQFYRDQRAEAAAIEAVLAKATEEATKE